MYNSSISSHSKDTLSSTASLIQNTSVIDQISKHPKVNSSHDDKEDDRDLRIQDELTFDSMEFNSHELFLENDLIPNQVAVKYLFLMHQII